MLRRRSVKHGVLAAGMALPVVAAAGCTDDGVALHIECNIAPDVSEEGCVWDSSSTTCVFDGQLNVRAATSYVAGFRVVSGLKPRKSTSPPRSEPNGIQLSEAEVELRSPGGNSLSFPDGLPNPYTLVSTGYVKPEGTGLMQVELLPAAYVEALRGFESDAETALGQVVASVKIRGLTDGKVEVETSAFNWPIRLISVSPVADDKECRVVEDGICSTLAGVDAFATACLCDASGPSCDQQGQ